MHYKMAKILREAYRDPARKFCYYSAANAGTASNRLENMAYWDWTPAVSHRVGCSTCLFALQFGCEPYYLEGGKEWVYPLITDPDQVRDLQVPDVFAGRTGALLENYEQMLQQIPDGELLRNPDIQSPLGMAELMWDTSFYISLIEEPEAVHELLDKITRFIINYVQALQKIAGEKYNPCGFPPIWADGAGTMISDDSMSLVSPDMHTTFSVPYLNRIADSVGPLYYHSCTWRKPHFESIKQIRNVRAYNWNPGNSDDPSEIIPAFSGKAVLALHLCKDMHRDKDVLAWNKNFEDEAALFEYILDCMQEDTCMYWWFSNICDKGDIMEKIYDILHERGYTPQAVGIA